MKRSEDLYSYRLDGKYLPQIKKLLKVALVKNDASLTQRTIDLSKRKNEVIAKIDSLDENFIENTISQELYDKFSIRYKAELQQLNEETPKKQTRLSNPERYSKSYR